MRELGENKKMILEAAQEVFGRYGFRKTTMEDIARGARKGKSSLYHYFNSKEEIFKEVIEKEVDELKKEIEKTIAAEKSFKEKIRLYVITRMRAIKRLANLYTAFEEEYYESYSFIQEFRQKYDEYEIGFIGGILKDGVEQGVFKIKDVGLTAFSIFTAIKGLEYYWATKHDEASLEKNLRSLMDVLFYGIARER